MAKKQLTELQEQWRKVNKAVLDLRAQAKAAGDEDLALRCAKAYYALTMPHK